MLTSAEKYETRGGKEKKGEAGRGKDFVCDFNKTIDILGRNGQRKLLGKGGKPHGS